MWFPPLNPFMLNDALPVLSNAELLKYSLSMYNVTLPVGIVPFSYLQTRIVIVPFSP